MPIEFRHLRYVLAADKHRSFRQAAAALRLKQSTLSRRIHQLEDELGVLLFARHSGGVRSITAGQEFLRRAKRITEENLQRDPLSPRLRRVLRISGRKAFWCLPRDDCESRPWRRIRQGPLAGQGPHSARPLSPCGAPRL